MKIKTFEQDKTKIRNSEIHTKTSRIVNLNFEIAFEAGGISEDLKLEAKGWDLADSIVLCTAGILKGKVVTGDEHFRHLDNVVFVKP
jgi:predicted nucleic acid-binding protein